ncbi:MAG: HNH endonuclease [Nitrospira sp.]|nr:MAG: HNH endonuclease [Nitrospira sp.]
MAISDKTRKLLWSRSGNRCAICRLELAIDATVCDDASLIGEECHIHSGRKTGPRHNSSFEIDEIDAYENLLVLCRAHHKMVDDQNETYTAEILRQIKNNHEKWVQEKLAEASELKPIRLRRIKENALVCLVRLTSGREVLNIVDRASAFSFDHDELVSDGEAELVGGFIQEARDWGELSGDLEPIQKVRTGFHLSRSLEQLEEAGFFVFGGREVHRLEGGVGTPSPWPVAIIRVVRSTNSEIVSTASDGVGSETLQKGDSGSASSSSAKY